MIKKADLTLAQLASELRITPVTLCKIAHQTERLYYPTIRRCIKGKYREINEPKPFLKEILRRLHRYLCRNFPAHTAAHGGVPGKSCVSAATVHLNRKYIITRDIEDCYPSIDVDSLDMSLQTLGFKPLTALILSKLLTVHGCIPQGAPTSSDALNLFLWSTDERIRHLTSCMGARYSRSADDLVVSVGRKKHVEKLGRLLDSEIQSVGLKVNEKKKSAVGLQDASRSRFVHNLVVDHAAGVGIPHEQKMRAIEAAVSYVRTAKCVSHDSLLAAARKRSIVHGWVYYCRQAKFAPTKHLSRLMRQGDRHIKRRLKTAGIPFDQRWWSVPKVRRQISKRWHAAISNSAQG